MGTTRGEVVLEVQTFFEDHCIHAPGLRIKFQIDLNILSVFKIKNKISEWAAKIATSEPKKCGSGWS